MIDVQTYGIELLREYVKSLELELNELKNRVDTIESYLRVISS